MGLLGSIFTWWNGATIGTTLSLRGMKRVGEDAQGNVYYMGGKGVDGRPRRWCIYKGSNDASRVPPDWFSWLHHQIDDMPDSGLPQQRQWEKAPTPNLTGTAQAYRPPGALEAGGVRAASTGDYEAWSPDQT